MDTLGSITGEWVAPFPYSVDAFFDGMRLFVNAWNTDAAGIGALEEPYYGNLDMFMLYPLLWRFEAPIDP